VIFTETELSGAFLVEPDRKRDDRGFFARVWDGDLLRRNGLNDALAQASTAYNDRRSTLRGLHFQRPPHEEAKLVRCTRGSLYDVALDIRPDSPTYLQWEAVELTEGNRLMFYVPEGFAHGYQTLLDDTEVFYQMSELYHPESARGLRWDDPKLGIRWPLPVSVISERDTQFELLK
jgi:dTDP-4-dehydrorhamnose 3,5-epimerase